MTKMRFSVGLMLFGLLLLGGATVYAAMGVNPASPGLATGEYPAIGSYSAKAISNNQFSTMCVDCHSRQPLRGPANDNTGGSHFVSKHPDATGADLTNSGGGFGTAGTDSQAGPRDGGQYFKTSTWGAFSGGASVFSKYGDPTNDRSVSWDNVNTNHTSLQNTTASSYASQEIICESCHNIINNAAGGNNLVTTPATQSTALSMCNGCHGDMYDADAASAGAPSSPAGANATVNATKYADTRNDSEVAGGKRGVNTIHVVRGVQRDMNHHVTTGDVVNATIVTAMQTWRDVETISADAILNPVSGVAGETRGQMPQRGTWDPDDAWTGRKVKSGATISCLMCHTPGHGGNTFTAGSILRDRSPLKASAPADNTARLSDAGRGIWDFNDTRYCNDCHTLK